MVDRLGFVKTLEAILAAIIMMSMYGIINDFITKQVGAYQRDPTFLMNDFIEMLAKNNLINDAINNYEYSEMDALFYEYFLKSIYYYFEPRYYERIKVKSEINKTYPNISFVYHFPFGIDENSVRVTGNEYELPTKALFNWYATPIVFLEDINNSYVEVNITIEASGIDNKTLMYFVNDKRSILDVHKWTKVDQDMYNATLVLFVPEVKKNVLTYVYAAQNDSMINFTYPSLNKNLDIQYYQLNTFKTTTGLVVFTPENVSSTRDDTYYIEYTLYSHQDDNYADIKIVNNTGITIIPELDYVKHGSSPAYATTKGEYSVKRLFPKKGGFVELTVYGGYS